MFRRALSRSAVATNTGAPQLAPRSDVDLGEQRRMVAQDRAAVRAKQLKKDRGDSLYGVLAPHEEARVMEFNRHSLRLLVLEAHNRQIKQHEQVHVDPTSDLMMGAPHASDSAASTPTGTQQPPRRMTPPPESHFDLTTRPNFNALLQDIDTLMAVAQTKPPQTRDRILNQTYEQLARLDLWNDQ